MKDLASQALALALFYIEVFSTCLWRSIIFMPSHIKSFLFSLEPLDAGPHRFLKLCLPTFTNV
jgi:hypothetical protein